MKFLITVSYDGSEYYGFQRLNNYKTVQKELEDALSKINKKKVIIKGSGRTDRGVHAINQKCHFTLDINIPPERLKNALNSLVSNSLFVKDCTLVNDDFHARFSVLKKHYKYLINIGEFNPIKDKYVYNYCKKLDITLMRKASKKLLGRKSFEAFVSGKRENYNSIIYKVRICKKNDIIFLDFIGKSFYKYMVRNIVGALILVGSHKISLEDFNDIVDSKKTITYMTAPANGLYLFDVIY